MYIGLYGGCRNMAMQERCLTKCMQESRNAVKCNSRGRMRLGSTSSSNLICNLQGLFFASSYCTQHLLYPPVLWEADN
jgi:hypothetical protein